MKKSLAVWIFGCLTFFAGLHTFDAVLSLGSSGGNRGSLPQLYPFYEKISEIIGELNAVTYFWLSLISTLAFMGVTFSVAFYDPILAYVKKTISETKIDDAQADRLDSELTALAMINESLTTQGVVLNNVKSELGTFKDGINALKIDMTRLRSKLEGLETDIAKLRKCPACGKNVHLKFKFCPHCGEELSLYVLVRRLPEQGSGLIKKELAT